MDRKVRHFAGWGVTPSPCLQVIISVDCNTQVIYFSVKSGTEIGRLRIGSFRPCPVRRDVPPPLSLPMTQRGVEDNSASDEAWRPWRPPVFWTRTREVVGMRAGVKNARRGSHCALFLESFWTEVWNVYKNGFDRVNRSFSINVWNIYAFDCVNRTLLSTLQTFRCFRLPESHFAVNVGNV